MNRFQPLPIAKAVCVSMLVLTAACRCHRCGDSSRETTAPPSHQPVVNRDKVVLLHVINHSPYPNSTLRLDQSLHSALSSCRHFDVIRPTENGLHCVPPIGLVDRINQFRHEAVGAIVATIEEYEPYPRPRLTVRIEMYRTLDTIRVASLTGHFDSADLATADAVRQFYISVSDSRNPGTSDVMLDSPELYFRFAAQQLTASLINLLQSQSGIWKVQNAAVAPVINSAI